MRLIMMGTGPFAEPTMRALYDTPHEVLALVTQPLRSGPGKRPAQVSPLREVAAERSTPVYDPENVNVPEVQAALREMRADLLIVADYGQILAPQTLSVARLGGVNLHGSLLPKYRGAAPINWAIYHGESQTGVTVIHMTPQIDAGPALAQASTAIEPDETAVELEQRLAELGAPLVCRTIEALEAGRADAIAQDRSQASRAPRLKKSDGVVDWSRPAEALRNQVRALQPWPKTFSFLRHGDRPPLRLILDRVSVDASPAGAPPGTVLEATAERFSVATGKGQLMLEQVQPAGKRVMTAGEFLRGYPVVPDDQLGADENAT